MRDPYLYDDVPVLRNLLNIRDADVLERAEADITSIRLLVVDGAIPSPLFDCVPEYISHDLIHSMGSFVGTPRFDEAEQGVEVLRRDFLDPHCDERGQNDPVDSALDVYGVSL